MADAPQPDPNALVKAYSPSGEKIQVKAADAGRLTAAGGRVADAEELAEHNTDAAAARANEKLGTVGKIGYSLVGGLPSVLGGGQGVAWQQAVARGGTAGLSDLAIKEAAESYGGKKAGTQAVQALDDAKTGYSTTSSLGEAAGTIAATAATAGMGGPGGGTGLMRFAGPAGISSMLGGAAEGGLARVIGTRLGAGIAGQALKTGLTMGARGLAEGAFMSGVQQANEDLLRDRDLSAEKILAASAHGALIGGATGFGLGAGGSLAGAAGRGLLSSFSNSASRAEGGLARVAGTADDALMRAEAAAGKAESAATKIGARIEERLPEYQNEAMMRALGGTKNDVKKLALKLHTPDAEEVAQKMGGWIAKKGIVAAGDNSSNILAKLTDTIEEAGQRVGGTLDQSAGRVKLYDMAKSVKEIADEAGKSAGSVKHAGAAYRQFEDVVQAMKNAGQMADDGTVSVADLARQRQSIAPNLYDKATASVQRKIEQQVERTIENHVESAIAKADGAEVLAGYKSAKTDVHYGKLAETMAEHGTRRDVGNMLGGGLTGTLGSVGMSIITGTPLAAIPTAVGFGLLRTRGMSTAAAALGNVSQLGVLRGITQTMDELVGRASKGIVTPAKIATKGIGGGAPKVNQVEKATQSIAALAKVQANPQGFAERLAQHTEPIRAVSPELAGSYTETATRAMAFLAGKMPERLPANDPINPNAQRTLTTTDAIKFNRSVEAVTNPKAVMEEMSRGIVIPEHVEAIRAVYPSLFRQMQVAALEQVASAAAKGKPISFNARLRLGVVMDAPTDASLTVAGIQFRQGNVATPPDTKSTMPQRPIEVRATKLTSQYDRIEGGE